MPARLGFGFTTTFPLLIPIRDSLQFPSVNVIWLCSPDLEVAESAESWPGQFTAGRRYWLPRPPAKTEGPNLAEAHSRIGGQSL